MPSKKKKYNARFPAGRIKKIMQSDEEIGKVAQAVPVIISRTLELFVESLLTKTLRITNGRNAKTLSPSHMKQCIMAEQRFDFLKELVKNIPDISVAEEASNYNDDEAQSSEEPYPDSDTPYDLSLPSTSTRAHSNGNSTYVRSVSLNGSGLKRNINQTMPTSTVVQATATLSQAQQPTVHLPTKLARSESTPAYTARGRPPNHTRNTSKQTQDTAIPATICSYDLLKKPVVKIDYSNMQLSTATEAGTGKSENASFNFKDPVINIDLSNIVATAVTTTDPANICYETSVSGNNNNSSMMGKKSASISLSYNAGNSKTSIIPKAPMATAPMSDSLFELDEDYDNI